MYKKLYLVILLAINIICLTLLLQMKFKLFPLINCRLNETVCENINELIANISIGIIVSTIFYFIVVYFPDRSRRNTTLKIIQPRLNTILGQINISLNYLIKKRLNCDKKILQLNDFELINSLDARQMDFQYKIFGNSDKWIPFSTGEITEIVHFDRERRLVINKIDEIFEIPTVSILDEDLVSNLAQLRDCLFYSAVESYNKYGSRVTVTYFTKAVYDYYLLFQTLQKYGRFPPFRINNVL